ncbi:hypothetical protein VCRA2122O10_100050 [Vibrio crassostreae]|nr:hypothetical protein VCRA2122O10_100050 [Vibrio crassostreae]CAK3456893.1 hypothetical protein VCRA2120O9_360002 [Vibrio crassostreae]
MLTSVIKDNFNVFSASYILYITYQLKWWPTSYRLCIQH